MLRASTALLKFLTLGAVVANASLLHHGHIRDFLHAVYDALSHRLPKRLRKHEWRVRTSILQVYFDDPTVHYEVWVQRKGWCIEIGLHFEGEREQNYRWAAALAPRALEIQSQLGPGVELEEWTAKWTRLHESLPLSGDPKKPIKLVLSEELVEEIADRVARFVEVMEPVLAEERKRRVAG
ncbi:MAG: hypothetical protein WEE64_08450 [Dehalococcoidia bacterium]